MAIEVNRTPERRIRPEEFTPRAEQLVRRATGVARLRDIPSRGVHPSFGAVPLIEAAELGKTSFLSAIELEKRTSGESKGYFITIMPMDPDLQIGRPISLKSLPNEKAEDLQRRYDALRTEFTPDSERVYTVLGLVDGEWETVSGLYGTPGLSTGRQATDAETLTHSCLRALESDNAYLFINHTFTPSELGTRALQFTNQG